MLFSFHKNSEFHCAAIDLSEKFETWLMCAWFICLCDFIISSNLLWVTGVTFPIVFYFWHTISDVVEIRIPVNAHL